MLAGESKELVALGALGDLDTVLVGPGLDVTIGPRVQKSIGESLLGTGGSRRSGRGSLSSLVGSKAAVATDGGDKLVTAAGLRSWDATLIEPSLEVRVRPRFVEPVSRVGGSLSDLVRGRLVVGASGLEKRVASARGGVGDSVVVEERLDLRLSPAVQC